MNKTIGMLKQMDKDGVHVNVICKYGFQTPPFVASAKKLSDNTVDVYSQSFYGAACASTGRKLSADYIKACKKDGTIKYVSPDKQIDSTTALFPDTTWYIKYYEHNPFYDCFNEMIMDMCYSDTQMTVFSDARYPQYLNYDAETDSFAPVPPKYPAEDPAAGGNTGSGNKDDEENYGIFSPIVKFLRSIWEFILSLFGIKKK